MSIRIEIVCATSYKQKRMFLFIADGTTAQDAIVQSNILKHFPDIDLAHHKIGIFGKVISLSQVLADGDRIEIYRPLVADPKQARKARAKK